MFALIQCLLPGHGIGNLVPSPVHGCLLPHEASGSVGNRSVTIIDKSVSDRSVSTANRAYRGADVCLSGLVIVAIAEGHVPRASVTIGRGSGRPVRG